MTREELVEELNKIDGVKARIDGDVLCISGEDICDLQKVQKWSYVRDLIKNQKV